MDADMPIMAPYVIAWLLAVFIFLSAPAYLILSVPEIAAWMTTGRWKRKCGVVVFFFLGIVMIAIDLFYLWGIFQKNSGSFEVAIGLATGTGACFGSAAMLYKKDKQLALMNKSSGAEYHQNFEDSYVTDNQD